MILTIVWFILGLLAGAVFLAYARMRGVRHEVWTCAAGLLIAALIYVVFALVWGNAAWVLIEIAGFIACGLLVWGAFRHSFAWIGIGWLLHPLWDIPLHLRGPGHHVVPEWYAVACVSFDLLVGIYALTRTTRWRQQYQRPRSLAHPTHGERIPHDS